MFAFGAIDDHVKYHFIKGAAAVTAENLASAWMTFVSKDTLADFDLDVAYRGVIKRVYFPSARINAGLVGSSLATVVKDIDLRDALWYCNNLDVTVETNLDFTGTETSCADRYPQAEPNRGQPAYFWLSSARVCATRALAWPCPRPCSALSQFTSSICLVSGEERIKSCQCEIGRPYFFSIEGK
jgi:hypothetical protein